MRAALSLAGAAARCRRARPRATTRPPPGSPSRAHLLSSPLPVRIGFKISLACLAIVSVVALDGWLAGRRNDALRAELDELRESSLHEMLGASEMVLALESVHAATHELLAESWHAHHGGGPPADVTRPVAAIARGLDEFGARLLDSRTATETALAMATRRADERAIAEERYELYVWLDALDTELTQHRVLLESFAELAPADPTAASELLERRIDPHYRDEMVPLIRAYESNARRELEGAIEMVDSVLTAADRGNVTATAVALVLAIAAGLLLARAITRPMQRLAGAALALGGGRLDVRVPEAGRDEVGDLARAFNGMAARLEASTVSKSYVDDIIRSMGEILIVTDRDGRIRTVNRAAEEQLGWPAAELVGRELREVVPEHSTPGEVLLRTRNGQRLPAVCRPTGLWDDAGRPQGQVWVAQNVAHTKRVEEALRRSLADKEVLLREVHHRVKNNLQVISSMLRLQARSVDDAAVRRMFEDGDGRVRSMALVHEQLYRSGDLAQVDFGAYLERLAQNVGAATPRGGAPVEMQVSAAAVALPLDLAIACGLIVNELLANSIKHAFRDERAGRIAVGFALDGPLATLTVADDGVGFDADAVSQDGGLGLRLVEALVRQIGGALSLERSHGTSFRVEFAVPAGSREVLRRVPTT